MLHEKILNNVQLPTETCTSCSIVVVFGLCNFHFLTRWSNGQSKETDGDKDRRANGQAERESVRERWTDRKCSTELPAYHLVMALVTEYVVLYSENRMNLCLA